MPEERDPNPTERYLADRLRTLSTEPPQAWVDFNEVDDDGIVSTLRQHFQSDVDIRAGVLVVVGDHDGNRCTATIADVRGDVVDCYLMAESFYAAAPPKEH